MKLKNISKLIAICLCLSFLLVIANAGKISSEYILLEFHYDNGNFILLNKSLEQGNYPNQVYDRTYQLNLLSINDSTLFSTSFNPELLYSDYGDDELSGGVLNLNESVYYAVVPNFREANSVEIKKDNITIFKGDIYDVGATSCKL